MAYILVATLCGACGPVMIHEYSDRSKCEIMAIEMAVLGAPYPKCLPS